MADQQRAYRGPGVGRLRCMVSQVALLPLPGCDGLAADGEMGTAPRPAGAPEEGAR